MPNYPADYKQQESYYASQEYQTAAKTAIKENKKVQEAYLGAAMEDH